MKGYVLGLGAMLVLLSLLFILAPSITAVDSSNGAFTVTPDAIYVNWTNGTINITSNSNLLTVAIDNKTTQVYSNYSQYNRYQIGSYKSLTDTTWNLCFNSTPPYNMKFKVQNGTGLHNTTSKLLNETDTTFFYITPYMLCPPGKYYGYFYVKNATQPTENLTVEAYFQIPISEENTFNLTKNSGFFNGSMSLDKGYYHSYYFNTSIAENATGFIVRLGNSPSNDIDLFLYDSSGNFLSKSINRSSLEEIVVHDIPDTPEMYELRVYGNVSSDYNGFLSFSTLNVTDASGSGISQIDFGGLDANETSSNQVFVLTNEDDQTLSSVMERKEIYHIDQWLNQNTNGTFMLLVPSFAEKVKVRLEWRNETGTDATNWTLFLRDANGVLRGTSNSKHLNAERMTGSSVLEEYIEYSGSISTSNDGFWNITVKKNESGSLDGYNLTAYIYVSNSWLKTNYSTSNFNASQGMPVNVNVTIPETYALNGSYNGYIDYYRNSGFKTRIPVLFSVRTGTLVMNEEVELTSGKVTHNTGFNTVSAPLMIKIPYNNTGGYPLYVKVQNTTTNKLYQEGNNSNWVDIVLSDFPLAQVNPGASGFLDVSVKINTANTHNRAGLYRGFVLFDTTNSTNVTRQSSLFKTFNVTLYANLTNLLNITVTEINPSLVHPPTSAKNVTFKAKVRLINGTVISNDPYMGYTNFTQIRIMETNITDYEISLTNIVSGGTGGGGGCGSDLCNVNGTVQANLVGGRYEVYVSAKWNTKMFGGTGEVNLTGTGVTNNFQINQTGVYLKEATNKDFGEITEGTENLYFNMTVKNYGPLSIPSSSKGMIYFHEGTCYSVITARVKDYSCSNPSAGYNSTGAYLNYTMNAFETVGCWIRFEIDVDNISTTDKSCYMKISSANKRSFGNIDGILIDIVEAAPGDDVNTQAPATSTTGCTSNDDCNDEYMCSSGYCLPVSCTDGFVSNHKCNPHQKTLSITDYESKISVIQGGSVTTEVEVKNTGTTSLTVKLDATHNITGVDHSVTPSSYSIDSAEKYKYKIEFTLSDTTRVGNHPVTLKAYVKDDEDVSTTKTVYLSVEPLEETKRQINDTYGVYRNLFEMLKSQFLLVNPSSVSDVNFTKTNRTYSSLINMLNQVGEYLSNDQYADASDLLEDINASLSNFELQIKQLASETSIFGFMEMGDIWTWVAIGVVVVVIGVFMAYLLLPPKKGYHPVYGYRSPSKNPVIRKLEGLLGKLKGIGSGIGSGIKKPSFRKDQTTLTQFKEKIKKPYMEGYKKTESAYKGTGGLADKLRKKVKK